MSNRVSRAAVDSIKGRIDAKILELRLQLPTDLDKKAQLAAIKQLGLESVHKEWETAWKRLEQAKKDLKTIQDRLGEVFEYRYIPERPTLVEVLSSSTPYKFTQKVKEVKKQVLEGNPISKKIDGLEKLKKDVDLTLELAGSTAEVKAALKGILEAIGD